MAGKINILLIIVTAIISYNAFGSLSLKKKWIFNAYMIKHHKQWHRFLTSGFIHQDWGHLLFNMFTLYFIGDYVEYVLVQLYGGSGTWIYLALYLTGIIFSSVPDYFKYKDAAYFNSLGASGGVSSIVFAFIFLLPLQKLCLWGILCLPGFIFGILYMGYSVHLRKKGTDNINHDAHIWGAVYGILFLILLDYRHLFLFFEQMKEFSIF